MENTRFDSAVNELSADGCNLSAEAVNTAIACIEKQKLLKDFIGRLNPDGEEHLIVILRKYEV